MKLGPSKCIDSVNNLRQSKMKKVFKIVDVWSNKTHTIIAENHEIALRKAADKVNHLGLLIVSMNLL